MRAASLLRRAVLAVLVASAAASVRAQATPADEALVKAAVAAFHRALDSGDREAALRLLAPDAVVLEGGDLETRQQYQDHHLAADIQFAQATRSTRSTVAVTVQGDAAWISSVSTTSGQVNGKPLQLSGAELMVLTRAPSGWLIRAIHWSSRQRK